MLDNRERAVLVTGGAGFVGAYVVRRLLQAGARVVVYDTAPTSNVLSSVLGSGSGEPGLLLVERGSVTDAMRLVRVCQDHGVDRLVHLASPLTQDVADDSLGGVRDVCLGTGAVFETARAIGAARVVWASSVAVFGSRNDYPDGPIPNDAPHLPHTLYGSCKSLCERMAVDYRQRDGLESIGLRLTVVYGPGRRRGYMSFPSELISRAAAGLPIDVPLADLAINWQYVEDVADLAVHALDAKCPEAVAFNTSGDVRTFREAAAVLADLVPGLRSRFFTEPRDGAERALLDAPAAFDDGALRAQLGWAPAFSLERGVAASLSALRTDGRPVAERARA